MPAIEKCEDCGNVDSGKAQRIDLHVFCIPPVFRRFRVGNAVKTPLRFCSSLNLLFIRGNPEGTNMFSLKKCNEIGSKETKSRYKSLFLNGLSMYHVLFRALQFYSLRHSESIEHKFNPDGSVRCSFAFSF
jgi:hypothetical protein